MTDLIHALRARRDPLSDQAADEIERLTRLHHYHDSWQTAHAFLLARAQRGLEGAKLSLDRARSVLDLVQKMRQPSPTGTPAASTREAAVARDDAETK